MVSRKSLVSITFSEKAIRLDIIKEFRYQPETEKDNKNYYQERPSDTEKMVRFFAIAIVKGQIDLWRGVSSPTTVSNKTHWLSIGDRGEPVKLAP
jgi:hypothetical protein